MKPRPLAIGLLFGALLATRQAAAEPPPHQTDFPPEELRERRARLLDAIGPEAVALVQGAPLSDGFVVPRQSNDFYYLTGVETPHAYLLLDARSRRITLYLPARDERLERSEGSVLSAADAELARELTGVDEVSGTDALQGDWLGRLPAGAPPFIYAPSAPAERQGQSRHELAAANARVAADPWDARLPREARFAELLRVRYPRSELRDLTPLLDRLRSIKSPREIALIRRASQLAGLGLMAAARSTRAGVSEYQLDAAARYVFLVNGARLEAYRSITASGAANIWNAHYWRNTRTLENGDLVLMDYAPDYRYYVSDVARMWPVGGRFSAWQRDLLGFVLLYRNAVMRRIRPGAVPAEVLAEVRAELAPRLEATRFSKPSHAAAALKLLETGGGVFSHPVGMAVHDDGEYKPGRLQPGHVFSVDPQLWVPEENLYLRYEDTVAVTASGVENFTEFLPDGLDELEALVGRNGIVQAFPPEPAR
jgi:Xaa-Pro aminopeptidase